MCNEHHLSRPSGVYLSALLYKIRSVTSVQVCEVSMEVAPGIDTEFSKIVFLNPHREGSRG